jgi:predicted O-methyltransferase YrrM
MKMVDYPNWFAMGAQYYFEKYMTQVKDTPITALQIGAYTGDASLWLMENALTHPDSRLIDVDTWLGSDEQIHKEFNWSDVETVYQSKLEPYIKSGKIIPKKMKSTDFLRDARSKFNFVYIDGDHEAFAVLEDFTFVFDLVVPNGIIAFDDYTWGEYLPIHKRPAFAIDAIRNCYQDKVEIIDVGSQLWMRKL